MDKEVREFRFDSSWKLNNWKSSRQTPVLNDDLWKRLDALYTSHKVKLEYVKAHVGIHGNEMADFLATSGAKQPIGFVSNKPPE